MASYEEVNGIQGSSALNYMDDINAALPTEQNGTEPVPGWAHNAARYEWADEYGDVGPAVPELEAQLFNRATITTQGSALEALQEFTVTQEAPAPVLPVRMFDDAGLHPIMEENVKLCGYTSTTPIQAYCIPAVLQGNDVIGIAQTGSGKTAAYLVPTISRLMGKAKKLASARPNPIGYNESTDAVRAEPLILVICPTRELALQIFDDARRFCYRSMLRPCVAYGGGPKKEQLADLGKGCDILIGTVGRLNDIIRSNPERLSLNRLKFTILDEADEMLDAGWEKDMASLLPGGASEDSADHIFLMFSATFTKESRELARKYLQDDHVRIRIGRAGSTHKNIIQQVVWVEDDLKNKALMDLINDLKPARTLVFLNAIPNVDSVDDFLYNNTEFNAEFNVTSLHSGRTQREREDAIRAFRNGRAKVLITTGVASRGLDIHGVDLVVVYDLPSTKHTGIQEYVHRIGRTARMGNTGKATSFYNERNEDIAVDLVKLLIESKQEVPDFLEQYKPDGEAEVQFDDDTDNEGEGEAQADGGVSTETNGEAAGWGNADAGASGGVSVEPATEAAW